MVGFLTQQFPSRTSSWFDPKTGEMNPVQYNLMRSMWLRTGGGVADATANGLQSQITAQSVRIDSESANTALNTTAITSLSTNVSLNYAAKASPAFSGTPTVPTAAPGVATGQAASTAFVDTSFAKTATVAATYAPLASPVFTGSPVVPGYLTTVSATSTYAPLASPAFTGVPTVPTAAPGIATGQTASTAFVAAAVGVEAARAISAEALALSITSASATYAPKASPTFTGTLTTPAAALGTATGSTLALTGGAGFFAHTVPGTQPAAPVTLADVILAGRAYGLWA